MRPVLLLLLALLAPVALSDALFVTAAPPPLQTGFNPLWVGIPDPGFGLDEVAPDTAVKCPEWPTAPSADCYYVNADVTCSASGNGYPDVPRCEIPEGSLAAGTYVEIQGGVTNPYQPGGTIDFTGQGTQQDPIWINCVGEPKPEIQELTRFTGGASWHFIQGCRWTQNDEELSILYADHIVVRNNLFQGPGTVENGSVISIEGTSNTTEATYIVIYNNQFFDWGAWDQDINSDYHAIKPDDDAQWVWMLQNETSRVSGDSIQVGSERTVIEDIPHNIYLAGNIGYQNKENCVDIKRSRDVVISYETCYNILPSSTSPAGNGMVIHDNQPGGFTSYIWVFNSEMYDMPTGIFGSDQEHFYVVGNVIRDTILRPDPLGCTVDDRGECGAFRVEETFVAGGFYFNTIYNFYKGILHGDDNINFITENNIVANRYEPTSYDSLMFSQLEGMGHSIDTTLVHPSLRTSCGSSFDLDTTFPWNCRNDAQDFDVNGRTGDPAFLNPAGNDFRIGPTSDARGTGSKANWDAVKALFLGRYGDLYNIDKDRAGNPRCGETACDIGAYAYAP